jgi:hypothetical protein
MLLEVFEVARDLGERWELEQTSCFEGRKRILFGEIASQLVTSSTCFPNDISWRALDKR